MITAAEALRLPSAKLTAEEARAVIDLNTLGLTPTSLPMMGG